MTENEAAICDLLASDLRDRGIRYTVEEFPYDKSLDTMYSIFSVNSDEESNRTAWLDWVGSATLGMSKDAVHLGWNDVKIYAGTENGQHWVRMTTGLPQPVLWHDMTIGEVKYMMQHQAATPGYNNLALEDWHQLLQKHLETVSVSNREHYRRMLTDLAATALTTAERILTGQL
jgi:hypothetical protein